VRQICNSRAALRLLIPDFSVPQHSATATARLFCVASFAACMLGGPPIAGQAAVPQPPTSADQTADPPGRVGRLTEVQGAVSFRAAADTEWGLADENQPVTTGDRVWSDSDGRAEVELGGATVRLWHETEVDVVRLDDHTVQFGVPQGGAIVRLTEFGAADVAEIDAPNAAVTPTRTGEYRVDVSPDGKTTTVTVWSGSADVTSGGSSFTLQGHQVATIRGDSTAVPTSDDGRVNSAVAERQYVPSDMPGFEDLDDNGTWDNDSDDGPVWYPTQVADGWVPYRYGHWVWFGAWGWTWVDDAPWGWAPFHYGRWAYIHNRWGWCPGRVMAPAVFAPALVVFVGGPAWAGGPGVGPGGRYGWFPLAPGEVYRPPYAVSTPYIRRVNITTVTNVTNITNVTVVSYRNRGVANAVTVVPSNVFENGAPVSRSTVRVPAADIARAPLLTTAPAVVPTEASIVARPAGRGVVAPPAAIRQRGVVALHSPPPSPAPLSAQLRTVAANGGRPLTAQQLSALRSTGPSADLVRPIRSAAKAIGPSLTPARPGLPAPHPALANAVGRPVGPPATGVRVASPPSSEPSTSRPGQGGESSSLTESYAQERNAQETRHIQEFAQPPAGESQASLAARQEAEDQALESRYHQAAASGRTTMPPRSNAPASRPASSKR
jgi:hypothetical protein